MSSLPKYTLFTDKTLREREVDPNKFSEDVAETERANAEWDTDGGYANLIQECRVAAGGDENRAEDILLKRVAHMAATRYVKDLEEEERRRAAAAEENKKRKAEAEAEAEAEDEEVQRKLKRKKKKNSHRGGPPAVMTNGRIDFALIGLDPPPRDFGEWIKGRYGGVRDVKLVIMKGLFRTDLSKNHNRFSMPVKQIIDVDFLTAEEEGFLNNRKGEGRSSPPGIPVKLFGPVAEECTDMVLKKWELKKSDSYVLNKGWMSLVNKYRNMFRKRAVVQLWSFRTAASGELAFCIVKVAQLEGGGEESVDEVPAANRPLGSGFRSGSSVGSGSGYGSGSGSGSESDPSGSRSRSEDGSDEGSPGGGRGRNDGGESSGSGSGSSDRDSSGLELEGKVTPPRRGPRVWIGSGPPPH